MGVKSVIQICSWPAESGAQFLIRDHLSVWKKLFINGDVITFQEVFKIIQADAVLVAGQLNGF